MPHVTDAERTIAVEHAAKMWRSTFTPQCHYIQHRCEDRNCEVIEITYAAVFRSGVVSVSLVRPTSETCDPIERPFPLYGCLKSGHVHPCGRACDRNELTCPISGTRFREEMRDGWWSEYQREGRDNWKMKVFGQYRSLRIEAVNVRDKLTLEGDQIYQATAMLEESRRRARLSSKSEAFDIAFSVAAVVLSDDRFEETLRRYHEQRAKLIDQAKRAATHMMQRRMPVNAALLMQALPAHPESHPVMIQSRMETRGLIVRYAEHCIALWHLVYDRVDRTIAEMSFRDFCTAAMNLFGKGHNVPDWRWGHDTWVVLADPVLNAFPLNRWAERKIYSEMEDTKISGVMRRAESRLKEMLDDYVMNRDARAAYLNYATTPYDEVPEEAFGNVKR